MAIAGIDIGGTRIKYGLFEGETLVWRGSSESVHGDAEALADKIAQTLSNAPGPFEKAGVGSAGRVNLQTGTVTASNLSLREALLKGLLEKKLGVPVRIDNDAQVALLAEWTRGACVGAGTVAYLTIGTGVGGALIVNGSPFRGPDNTGGELGHMITHAEGEPCPCGMRGCFERYASAQALSRMTGGRMDPPEILSRARAGDEYCKSVFGSYLRELGYGIVTIMRVFSPELIVIGGGLSRAGEYLRASLAESLEREMGAMGKKAAPRLRLAMHDNDAGIIGAAALAIL